LFVGSSLSLIVVGIMLILLEIFIIPGFGITGIAGLAMLLGGVFFVADTFAEGLIYLFITVLTTGLLIYIGFKTGRVKMLWKKISLREKQNSEEGYIAPRREYSGYLGKSGTAITLLRPAGTAEIDGDRVDVVSDGSFVPKDSRIKVIAVEGTRIIVRKDEND